MEPVQGFVGNQSFRILTRTGELYYLKSGPASAIGAEARACERARQEDVLAPIVVKAELRPTDLPQAYLIQRAVVGGPVQDDDIAILSAAGEQLRRLHTIAGTGYGFLNERGGLRSSWSHVIQQPIESLDSLTAAGVLPANLVLRLRKSLPAAIDRLEPGPPVLLHGDLHPRHVFASDGKLTGIIDWGDAAFGDPLFDLGRFSRAGSTATAALLTGYGLERTPEPTWTITLYRIIWSAMALCWEFAAGGDWFAEHIAAITHGLRELELNR